MKIAFLSGKGGTGKTLLAVNLACVSPPALYVDCDVEEPNGHLFLKPVWEREREVTVPLPRVDPALCDGCRKCVEFCAFHALAWAGGQLLVFDELCHGCGRCLLVCPRQALSETRRPVGTVRQGDLFGFHDQYRDYYLDAASYDPDNAILAPDGSLFEMSRWAGGRQNYLCARLAPRYVRRNFEEILGRDIRPDCTYLDVFTCNEPDECANPRHRMTRRECQDLRGQCFEYLLSRGIVPSSEEAADWAMGSLVFCHWAPYAQGFVPLPLFNLVYHDALLIPWMLGYGAWGTPEGDWGFLHALLNGGMGYIDGDLTGEALSENIRQCAVVSGLHEKVAFSEMLSHRFLSPDGRVQETVFEDGTTVRVDFGGRTYRIGGSRA